MQLTKPELRQQLKARRLALTELERQAKSQAIIARLPEIIDWSDVTNLHCFEPIEALNEVNMNKNHIDAKNIYTDKKIDSTWQTVVIKGNESIPAKYDVIIVPMLGFDVGLHRIGYGGGFYDKFLASQPEARKIGVCFDICKVEQIPIEPHDIPLDLVITETAIYSPKDAQTTASS